MKSIAQVVALSLFAVVTTAAVAGPDQPYLYGKGELGLIANPAASKMDTAAHIGASTESLLIVGKGEAGLMANPKAVQAPKMVFTPGFKSVPGEVGIVKS